MLADLRYALRQLVHRPVFTVVALLTMALGVGATWLGLRGIENLYADYEFIQYLVRMDWTMVLLAVALAVLSALGAALYPTWRACNITPASQLRIQ